MNWKIKLQLCFHQLCCLNALGLGKCQVDVSWLHVIPSFKAFESV